jgi:plasmid maintenance system antidote protein VapI
LSSELGYNWFSAVRLAHFLGITLGFWLNMQRRYELDMAEEEAEQTRREITPLEA